MNFYQFPASALSEVRINDALKTYIPEDHRFVEHPKDADIIIMRSAISKIPLYYSIIDRPIVYSFECGDIETSIANIKKVYRDCDLIFTYNLDLLESLQSDIDIFYLALGVSDEFYPIEGIEKEYEVFFPSPHNWDGFYSYYQELNKRSKMTCYAAMNPDSMSSKHRNLLRDNISLEFAWPLKEDEKLNKIYNSSRFTMDYHPTGIGIGCLEGLMAGAVPIIIDTRATREIYRESAAFFRTIDDFKAIIDSDVVWSKELADEVKSRLSWRIVTQNFWDKVIEKYQ